MVPLGRGYAAGDSVIGPSLEGAPDLEPVRFGHGLREGSREGGGEDDRGSGGAISEWNDPKAVDRLVAKMKHPFQIAR